jgi:hypothetical protein
MACPQKTGASTLAQPEERGSRLPFEWIVNGFTAVCFWTVPRRLIVGLESLPGSGLEKTLVDSIESE